MIRKLHIQALLVKAADDWSRDTAPHGFTAPITTVNCLLSLTNGRGAKT